MKPFTNFESRMVKLPINNVDTDQIIPARFLKTVSKAGLDHQLQARRLRFLRASRQDEIRRLRSGRARHGDPRDHRRDERSQEARLGRDLPGGDADQRARSADPQALIRIDLPNQTLTTPSGRKVEFPVDAFSKHCLVEGVDELGYIQQHEAQIAAYEARRVGSIDTAAAH